MRRKGRKRYRRERKREKYENNLKERWKGMRVVGKRRLRKGDREKEKRRKRSGRGNEGKV